jgi:hypothetical protein
MRFISQKILAGMGTDDQIIQPLKMDEQMFMS